jgi:hypothetical protein
MKNFLKVVGLGAMLLGVSGSLVQAATAPVAPAAPVAAETAEATIKSTNPDIRRVVGTLRQAPKIFKTVADGVAEADKFGLGPIARPVAEQLPNIKRVIDKAVVLAELLDDLEGMQKEIQAAFDKIKQLSTLAMCAKQSGAVLKNPAISKICAPIGCATQAECLRVGIDNVRILWDTLNRTLFSSTGLVPRILDLAEQPGLKGTVKTQIHDKLAGVIAMLEGLRGLIQAKIQAKQ